MNASEELARRQREFPLNQKADRGAALFASLAPLDVPELETLRLSQAMVVGEVGRTLPNAKTFHYSDGSHAIMLYSGLIDFLDAVTEILFGATNLYFGSHVQKTQRTVDDVILELQALFDRWKPNGLAGVVNPRLSMSQLSPQSTADAAMMSQAAELFILSHEFGHVFYYQPPGEDDDPSIVPLLSHEQEFAADATGMRNLIRTAPSPAAARMRFAGVMVSLRVLAVFASLGHTFPNDHPQPIERLEAVGNSARAFCRTPRDYWSLSPIAYAYDEMLEVAGLKALHSTDRPALLSARIFSRLSSVLEEAVKGSVPSTEVLDTMAPDFRDAPPEMLADVAMTAARMFPLTPTQSSSPNQDALWAKKAELFRSLDHQWPEVARQAFHAAFKKLQSQEG